MSEERRIEKIPIQKIIPNIYQPRIKFDNKSIMELADSIKKHGIIQPLILRKADDFYEIIDGERRYKAAKKIGLEKLPSIILDIDDKEAIELILTENMQKQLLTPIEEANAYQQIMLLNKINIEELSLKLGKEKTIIENKLKLLTLPTQIQEALLNNKIAEGHARLLTKVNDREEKLKLFNKVLKERITVKALEEIINKEEKLEDEPILDKKVKIENDKISLNDLNRKDFLTVKKENKTEDNEMDNTQMNFNQYNNLLKEKDMPEMGVMGQPEPIIGNTVNPPMDNEFFPSLEEQPLNIEIPIANQQDIPVPMGNMEIPAPMAQPTISNIEVPQMNTVATSMQMPHFDASSQNVGMPAPMAQPAMETIEVPQMNTVPTSMQTPHFEVPSQNMEMPVQMAQPVMDLPPIGEIPQFEMPVFNEPAMEFTQSNTPVMNEFNVPTESITKPVMTNVMPAVNMIRNLMPLLENSGYKINIEESDNPNEYQIIIKVEK